MTYQHWGCVDAAALLAELSIEDYIRALQFQVEGRSLLVDLLSRRSRRVVNVSRLFELDGINISHRKLMPFVKEVVAGALNNTVPQSLAVS